MLKAQMHETKPKNISKHILALIMRFPPHSKCVIPQFAAENFSNMSTFPLPAIFFTMESNCITILYESLPSECYPKTNKMHKQNCLWKECLLA